MYENLANQTEALLPKLKADSVTTERRGKIKKAVIDDLKRRGFFRIFQPKKFGGYELEFYEFVNIMRT